MNGGIADAYLVRETLPYIIIEIKLTQTADAYYQLNRYAHNFPLPVARCIITKTVVREISTPEKPTYLPKLEDLASSSIIVGGYYIIPHSGKILK